MTSHPIDSLRALAETGSALDDLDPETFVEVVADELETLSVQFINVELQLSRANIPQLCADLRRGMIEQAIERVVSEGTDPDVARRLVDPAKLTLPRRIETYAALYPSVKLSLSAQEARQLASDLQRGIELRPGS